MILADDRRGGERRARGARAAAAQPTSSGIFEAMDGLPVTIRLLDPPLHEFLPDVEELLVARRQGRARRRGPTSCSPPRSSGTRRTRCSARAAAASASSSPACTAMQVRAIIEAAVARKQAGGDPHVEIMIPLIVTEPELALLDGWVREEADDGARRPRASTRRLPRRHDDRDAARRARRRRDRRGRRVLLVRHQRPHADDVRLLAATTSRAASCRSTSSRSCSAPTRSRRSTATASASSCAMGVERGRATRPDIKLGICGEHGGDPASVAVLPRGRARLRVVLAVPGADRPPRRRPRRARPRRAGEHRVTLGSRPSAVPGGGSDFPLGCRR